MPRAAATLKPLSAPEPYISGAELREWLSLSPATLHRYVAAGLPHVGGRGGRARRFSRVAVLCWLGERGQTGGAR